MKVPFRAVILAAIVLVLSAVTLADVAASSPARIAGTPIARDALVEIASTVETAPVATAGDSADDPAIWVHPTNPRLSLVIGNNKSGALESYDLAGERVQRINASTGFFGNVDVRGNLVAVGGDGIRVFTINPATRTMSGANEGAKIKTSGEGLCLYDPAPIGIAGGLFAFTITRDKGRVREYSLADADKDGLVTGDVVRDFTIGTEAEGCVANDASGDLFISEEDVALWRYSADADAGTARTKVAAVNSSLPSDAEGVTVAGSLLLVSAQNVASPQQNFINVYESSMPYSYVGRVRVTAGVASDDCDRTDGIAAYAGNLGAAFSRGLLVCQDGSNDGPGTTGHQNFKLASLGPVLDLS